MPRKIQQSKECKRPGFSVKGVKPMKSHCPPIPLNPNTTQPPHPHPTTNPPSHQRQRIIPAPSTAPPSPPPTPSFLDQEKRGILEKRTELEWIQVKRKEKKKKSNATTKKATSESRLTAELGKLPTQDHPQLQAQIKGFKKGMFEVGNSSTPHVMALFP